MSNSFFSSSEANRRVRLRDGTVYRIRPLGRGDRHLLREGFQRLSPNSRRLRFFGVKKSLTEAELDFLTSPDGRDHIAFGAVSLDASGKDVEVESVGVGVARCIRLAPDSDVAELAIVVADDLQRMGIGGRLLKQLMKAARRQGIRRFRCEVLAENNSMRALAAPLGGDPRWLDGGVLEYDCPLPDPESKDEPPWMYWLFAPLEAQLACFFDLLDQATGSSVEIYR